MTTSRTETKFNVLIGNLNYLRLNSCVTLNCEVTYNSKSTTNTNIVLEISILEGYICTNQGGDQTCGNFDILSIKDLKVCCVISYSKPVSDVTTPATVLIVLISPSLASKVVIVAAVPTRGNNTNINYVLRLQLEI